MVDQRKKDRSNHWSLYGGRDPRDIPSYTTVEAARYVRLPLRTVQNWSFGFGKDRGGPLIHISNTEQYLLSFWNVAELHVLSALRRYHRISLPSLRRAIRYLEEVFDSPHPLLTEKMLTDGVSVFVEKTEGLLNASMSGQHAMRELLEAHLQRIEQDFDGIAGRLFPFVRNDSHGVHRTPDHLMNQPKVISLDPQIRFGRPVISGTSIPTEEIAERFCAGDTFAAMAEEYGREAEEIEEAIRCELTLDRAA